MCGIHGIVSPRLSGEEIAHRLAAMAETQKHRGPDDQRHHLFTSQGSYVGFGFVRLSILDLETGMQPLICDADGTAIICNGQIYNYLELKNDVAGEPFTSKGDIEVALHLFRKYGLDFLQLLNGMYAGAIYAEKQGTIFLFRDRFGIKPLYYMCRDDAFYFASEIKPLFEGARERPVFNSRALAAYFSYRYVPGEETMFEGVRMLPPGSFLAYDIRTGRCTITRYWEYGFRRPAETLTLDEAAEQFYALFSDAVRIRLRADVEVGSLVSGGIDSSAVAALASEAKPGIKLFTISFKEEKYNELPRVRQFIDANNHRFRSAEFYSRVCGIETLESLASIVRSVEEPISLGTVLPTDRVSRMAAEKLKVVLTGEGADEIFAGYRKFLIESAAAGFDRLPEAQRHEFLAAYPELEGYMAVRQNDPLKRYIQSELLFDRDEIRELTGTDPGDIAFPPDARPRLNGDEDPVNAAIAMECRARLPDYVILRLDKLSMRHSLETRTPFLDFRLAEFAATLPITFKVDARLGKEKRILSRAFQKYGVLDRDTAERVKQPFTIPLADWLASPERLPERIKEIVLGDRVKHQGILNPAVLKRHLTRISAGNTGPATLVSAADRVFSIIVFSLWYDEFF